MAIEKTTLGKRAAEVDAAVQTLPEPALRALGALLACVVPVVRTHQAELEQLLSPAVGSALLGLGIELAFKAARGTERLKRAAGDAWECMPHVRSFTAAVLRTAELYDQRQAAAAAAAAAAAVPPALKALP